jgi:hypothetical protein
MFDLQQPRHIPTLPVSTFRASAARNVRYASDRYPLSRAKLRKSWLIILGLSELLRRKDKRP